MEENIDQEIIEKVEEIQTLIAVIGAQLIKHGLIPSNHVGNEACTSSAQIDESLKSYAQQLINQATI